MVYKCYIYLYKQNVEGVKCCVNFIYGHMTFIIKVLKQILTKGLKFRGITMLLFCSLNDNKLV